MALLTGIGDFFRGAFGEDAEEKKRRKQREAQEAAARKQKPAQSRPAPTQAATPNQGINTKPKEVLKAPPSQAEKPAPKPAPQAPRAAPLPDQEFLALTVKPGENKQLFGVKTPIKTKKVDVNRTVNTNKDKYVAAIDKLDPEVKKVVIQKAREKAAQGDKTAANTLKALEDTGRLKLSGEEKLERAAQFSAAPGASVTRVATGVGQGLSGLFDLVSPGKGTNRVSKALDRGAKNIDTYAKETDVDAAYKTGNVVGEVASYVIPSTAATKIAEKFPKGTKITTDIVEKAASLADNAGDAGKIRQALANGMRKAWTLDEILEETATTSKYIGENASKGNETTPASVATDIATSVVGNTTFRGIGDLFGAARKVKPDVAEAIEQRIADRAANVEKTAAQQTEKELEELRTWNQENVSRQLKGEEPLPRPVQELPEAPLETPSYAKQEKELPATTQIKKKLAQINNTLQKLKETDLKKKLTNAIREYPQYKDKLIKNFQVAKFTDNFTEIPAAQKLLERKAQLDDLVRESDELAAQGQKAVADQAAQVDETVQAQQATNAKVAEDQAARTTPIANQSSPDLTNNDAYAKFNEEAGLTSGSSDVDYVTAQQQLEKMAGNKTMDELTGRQALRVPAAVGEKTQGKVADALSDTAGKAGGKLLTSQNPVANMFGQTLYGLNRKSTLGNAEKSLVEQVLGRRGGLGNLGEEVVSNLETPIKQLDEVAQAATKEKVFNAFELYNNGQVDESLAIIKSFTPVERQYFEGIRELNVLRNNLNRATLSLDKVDEYANGMHMPRIFDQATFAKEFDADAIEAFATSQNRTLDLNPNKRRKQLEELSDELRETMLRDPARASAIRTEIALHNKGVSDYAASVSHIPGAVSDVPAKGFIEIPDTPRYGNVAGKYVRKDLAQPMLSGDNRFKSDAYQKVNSLLDKYQTTIMGKIENGLRKGLTVYNPATRLGNRGANLTQGAMAGFNVPEMAVSQQHFMNVLKRGGDEWTRLARTFGAIDDNQALARFSGVVSENTNSALKRATDSYSDVDTAAKIAMFKWRIQKGASPEDAARFVNRALPNIGNSGEVYSFFSKLPILGTPFRAIQPEVLRALASTATRNTVPFLVAMGTYTTLQNMSWEDVPPEERAQIQERFGAGQTPFAGVNKFLGEKGIPSDKVLPSSWSFNAGALFGTDPETGEANQVVDVDPRRLMGMYSINLGGESQADSLIDQGLKASPVNVPTNFNNGDWNFAPQNIVASRSFSPIWQALIDRDFRGKSVQDPESKIYNPDGSISQVRMNPETGQTEDKKDTNRLLQFLGRSYVPQINDAANIKDASDGKENFNGQTMNLPQAVSRLFGLKGEVFDDNRLQEMRDKEDFFNEKAEIDEQVKTLSKSEAEAYKRLTGYYKTDEMVANDFKEGSTRRKKAPQYEFSEDKWKELAAHPNLYQLLVDKKKRESAVPGTDGKTKPLQPEYDERLSESFRKQIIQNKMVAPGDDAELDQRMYSSPEWDYYQNLKDEYKTKAKDYYPQSENDEFTDELVKNQDSKFPTKPDILKQYSAQYKLYTDGKAEKPEWNDALTAQKEAYNKQTLNWTNEARTKRGLPAITWEVWNNPTFGFDESPSGFGFGFGGGGGGNSANYVNTLTELTNYGDSVKRFEAPEAQAMPNTVQIFQKLMAGSGGGKAKPKLGASAKGQ